MRKLTPEQLKTRLKMDYQIVTKMRDPLMSVTTYRNDADLEKRRNPIVSEDEGHLATHYLVTYYIRTLVGKDDYSEKTSVKFDLFANGNYPYTWPGCWVTSSRMPWTPHFKEGVPICIDHDLWEGYEGNMLLGQLFVHVAKLLNFDEIPRSENYGGLNPPAAAYWREVLDRKPITPNFPYPPLPPEADPAFTPARSRRADMFSAAPARRPDLFQPRPAVNPSPSPGGNEMFMPRSGN
jgi:hypothetical protein